MGPGDKDSSIESLRSKLYGREKMATRAVSHTEVTAPNYELPKDWQKISEGRLNIEEHHSMSFLTKLLIASFLFFVLAVSAAIFFFYRGSPYVSSENLVLEINGPETVRGGEVESFQVTITNNNNSTFEFAELLVEYPEGAIAADGDGAELKRARIPLGIIKSGQSEIKNLSIIIFGEKESEHLLRATVEYRISGSNAIFDKSVDHKVKITSSPLDIDVSLIEEVNSGQEVELVVNVISGSTETLSNLMLVVNYPPGFIYKSATPIPVVGSNGWKLGDLKAGDKRKIKIVGIVEGQDDEVKSFKVSVGIPKASGMELGLAYNSLFKTLSIKKPFVNIDFSFNGETGLEYLTNAGENVRVDLGWVNNLSDEITDVELKMEIKGAMVDERSISVNDGFYQSTGKSITWTKRTKSDLGSLAAGERGRTSFNISTLPISALRGTPPNNPTVTLTLNFKAKRLSDGRVSSNIESSVEKKIKVNSVVQLSNNLYYHSDVIPNSGPIPPRVGQETTYTVIWSVINSFNDLRSAEVRATLPAYVKWMGKVTPPNENVRFDANNGEVVWSVGNVSAGVGYNNPPREINFQVGITPSISQLSQAPILVSKPTLTAEDSFTGKLLQISKVQLTTLATEPGFKVGDDRVTQ